MLESSCPIPMACVLGEILAPGQDFHLSSHSLGQINVHIAFYTVYIKM